jgi:hypothetical protein
MLYKLCSAFFLLDFSHHLHPPSYPSFIMTSPCEPTAEEINVELTREEQEMKDQLVEKRRVAHSTVGSCVSDMLR